VPHGYQNHRPVRRQRFCGMTEARTTSSWLLEGLLALRLSRRQRLDVKVQLRERDRQPGILQTPPDDVI
jgi:hypothetical protein